ncbi:MAG: S1 RNA-binding domain-containing protein, partial [Lentisphaeria bacterium]|nr:S1 RNA-binding domain-containing protein [Lentisphaeria bacterium]
MSEKQSKKEIILNCELMERRMVLMHNGRLEEYLVERDNSEPKAGDIYLGKIINLDPMLQAAFVDIGAAKNAFLHYSDMLQGYAELAENYKEEVKAAEENNAVKKK